MTVYDTARLRFIAFILAIRGPVTIPAFGNTDPASLALELALTVALVRSDHRTAKLVTTIVTVGDTVTLVGLVDALLQVAALELRGGARDGRAPILVRVVKTIIITVTHPGLGDAVSRPLAGELEVSTGFLGTRISLVTSIAAVVLSITFPCHGDTSSVSTPKL